MSGTKRAFYEVAGAVITASLAVVTMIWLLSTQIEIGLTIEPWLR